MAKRKIVKNENAETIEKVEVTNVVEETISSIKDIEVIPSEDIKENVDVVEEKTLAKNVKNNKKPLMFGYIWNGQEYD